MIGADTALTGIMREAALLRAGVQRAHRVRAERAKAHRRDVEDRRRIRLGAIRPADRDAKFLRGMWLRRHRMMHPFIALAIDVFLGAERPLVEHHLGALINQGAGVAGKRHAVLLALEEILPHFRPYLFEQEADMRRDRVVAQNRVALLRQIADAEQRQRTEDDDRDEHHLPHLRVMVENPDSEQQRGNDAADRQHDEAWRERKQQRFHDIPQPDCSCVDRSLIQPAEQAPYDIRPGGHGCDGGSPKRLPNAESIRTGTPFAVQRNHRTRTAQWLCGRISWGILPS